MRERNDQACCYCASGPAAESRQPGCFASGESRENPGEESLLSSWGLFPGFLWARSPQTFITPTQQAKLVRYIQSSNFARRGSRGIMPLAQVWARGAPSVTPSPQIPICHHAWSPPDCSSGMPYRTQALFQVISAISSSGISLSSASFLNV